MRAAFGLLVGIAFAATPAVAGPSVLVVVEDGAAAPLVTPLQAALKAKGVASALAAEGSAGAACLKLAAAERARCLGDAAAAAPADAVLLVSAADMKGRLAVSLQLFASHTGELLEQEAAKFKPAEAARFLAAPAKTLAAAVKAQAAKNLKRPAEAAKPAPAPSAAQVETPAPAALVPAPKPAPAPAEPAAPAPAASSDQLKLALYDFRENGGAQQVALAAKALVSNELQRSRLFKVTTSEALASLLALERQKQLLGCSDDDNSCMAEMADALGVDYIVTGSVTKLPEAYSLELSLLDAKLARRVSSQLLSAKSESELLAVLPDAVVKLLAPLMAKRSGFLELATNERGAAVKVDDLVRGTTPLDANLLLPGGPHTVSVEKDGFITWQQEVVIGFNQVSKYAVTLVPSPDYVRAYESKHLKLRIGAWTATALTLAAAVAFAVPKVQIEQLNNSSSGFQYYKGRLVAGVEVEGGVDNRLEAQRLIGEMQTRLTASWIALGVGCVTAVAALVFWIIGNDPGRYAQFRVVAP